MTIKNTKLGGANFSDEQVTDYDLNDTFDATIVTGYSGIKTGLMSGIYATCIAYCGSYGDITPYDDAIVDIYTDSGGYLNTVNTGNTTSIHMGSQYNNITCCGDAISANYATCTIVNDGTASCVAVSSGTSCGVDSACWIGCEVDISGVEVISFDFYLCSFAQYIANTANATSTFSFEGVTNTLTAHAASGCVRCLVNYSYIFNRVNETCYNFYRNGVYACQVDFGTTCVQHNLYACSTGDNLANTATVCLSSYYVYDLAATIIEINEQTFDSTTNAIFPTLELTSGTESDILIDVEDGSSNVLACDVPLNNFRSFSTCCPSVLVKYKLGNCDLKIVKGHGYKVIST